MNVSSYGASYIFGALAAAPPPAPLLLAVLGGDATSVYFPEWVGSHEKKRIKMSQRKSFQEIPSCPLRGAWVFALTRPLTLAGRVLQRRRALLSQRLQV